MSTYTEMLVQEIRAAQKDIDDTQRDIYIVAGVLGGVCLILTFCIAVLFFITYMINKKMDQMEERRRIATEISERRYSAYTGEEVHRKLQSSIPVNVATNQDTEYAFNHPVPEGYKLNSPPKKF